MGRQLRTRLPRWTPLSESISPANSDYQKRCYDRTAKQMPALQPGNTVRMRTDKGWAVRGTVKCQVAPRSYKVSAENGGMYVRNRRHLLHTKEDIQSDVIRPHRPPALVDDSTSEGTPLHQLHIEETKSSEITQSPSSMNQSPPSQTLSKPVLRRSARPHKPRVVFEP